MSDMRVKDISPAELLKMTSSATPPLIVDVREPWEIELAAFPLPHVNIPLGQLTVRLDEIPVEQEIVITCHFGGRSTQTCFILQNQGYERVYNLRGGIDSWAREIDSTIPRY